MQDLKQIVLSYHRVKGIESRVAHGVYGGIAANGVELEFFSESEDPTGSEEYVYDERGNVIDSSLNPDDPPRTKIVRTIHTRIYMNRQSARNMVNWLTDLLDGMDADERAVVEEDEFEGIDKSLIYSKTRQ